MRKWTYDAVKTESLKYDTKSEFRKESSGAYAFAWRNGCIDDICSHMDSSHYIRWTYEKLQKEALKYKTRSDFQKKCKSAYSRSYQKGIIDEICSHMNGNYHIWSKESVIKEAKKYKTRSKFQYGSPGAYNYSRKNEILNKVCDHMKEVGNLYKRGIYIIKFPKLKQFYVGLTGNYEKRTSEHSKFSHNKHVKALLEKGETYEYDYRNKWYGIETIGLKEQEWIDKMVKLGWRKLNINKAGGLGAGIRKWTKEKIIEESKKYTYLSDFLKNKSLYSGSIRHGVYHEISSSLIHKKKSWTNEELKEEASKYKTRAKFRGTKAYNVAKSRGILNEICNHLPNKGYKVI